MSPRRWLVSVPALGAALACGGLVPVPAPPPEEVLEPVAAPPPEPPRLPFTPNVLLIVADDLGTDKVGAYREHPEAPATPTLDRLAADGVLFKNAYAYSAGAPSRAALLTGRYGRRNGFGSAVAADPAVSELPLEEVTVPEMLTLSPSPWSTAAVGKWGLSSLATPHGVTHPSAQGFASYAGALGDLPDYDAFDKVVDGELRMERQYATSDTTDDAIERVLTMAPPWFMYVGYHAPHQPAHAPPAALLAEPLGAGATNADRIDAAVEAMDREVGRLLAAMSPEQLAQTVVVFVGDNGTDRAGIRPPREPDHGKGSLNEGGTNVPLIIAGPGVAKGSTTAALTHIVDLFPTIAGWAQVDLARLKRGASPLVLDGHDLRAVLADPSHAGPRSVVYTESFQPMGAGPYDIDWRAVRDERYKIVDVGKRRITFYDLGARDDDGQPLRPAQLTPDEQAAHDRLLAELERIELSLNYEY
jgi:arylsulfatase A-like enzyme